MKKVFLIFMTIFALVSCDNTIPTVSPEYATMHVGDTLQLVVTGKTNPRWAITSHYSKAIVKVINDNQVVALDTGKTYVFKSYSNMDREVGCDITIIE